MSKKITIQPYPGVDPWALAVLLQVSGRFHCHMTLHDGEIRLEGKNLQEVLSCILSSSPGALVNFQEKDRERSWMAIRPSVPEQPRFS